MGAIDRLAINLDLNPSSLALGNGDLDLCDLALLLLALRVGGVRIGRLVLRLIGIFIIVDGFGLLGRLLGSMQSPITNFARVIKQIAEQKEA